jgi:hypothetical protein
MNEQQLEVFPRQKIIKAEDICSPVVQMLAEHLSEYASRIAQRDIELHSSLRSDPTQGFNFTYRVALDGGMVMVIDIDFKDMEAFVHDGKRFIEILNESSTMQTAEGEIFYARARLKGDDLIIEEIIND